MWHRRNVLKGFAATGVIACTPQQVWSAVAAGHGPAPEPLLVVICDLIVPASDTPGAVDTRVPEFVAMAFERGLLGAEPATFTRTKTALDAAAGGSFLALAPGVRMSALQAFDAEAYGEASPSADWKLLKTLVLTGYYTSEAGATRELRYEFVPARFDPDIPFAPGTPGLMNDWWGNKF
mgnify:CR=1 FL=1